MGRLQREGEARRGPSVGWLRVGVVGLGLGLTHCSGGSMDGSATPTPEGSSATSTPAPTPAFEDEAAPQAPDTVYTVDADGGADYTDIQSAVDAAVGLTRINVKEGVYDAPVDFRAAEIQLIGNGRANKIILSATECQDRGPCSVLSITGGQTEASWVSGLTIEGGTGSVCETGIGPGPDTTDVFTCGGGIYIEGAAPTLQTLLLRDNRASVGAGIYLRVGTDTRPVMENISLVENFAVETEKSHEGGRGGALAIEGGGAILRNLWLGRNAASAEGGAIYLFGQSAGTEITNAVLVDNYAPAGAGLAATEASVTMTSSVLARNVASVFGGGVLLGSSAQVLIQGTIFYQNQARSASGGGADLYFACTEQAICSASLLYNNFFSLTEPFGGYSALTVSLAQEPVPQMRQDPLFNSPLDDDFRLRDVTSPSADSGPESLPEDPDNSRADMGAFASRFADRWDLDGDNVPLAWTPRTDVETGVTDCDDVNPDRYPSATEICDGIDNNCDGSSGYGEIDADGDGQMKCQRDCDDNDPNVFDQPSEPPESDGLDNNCDGVIDENTLSYDDDGDGFCEIGSETCAGGDCNDASAPDQIEIAALTYPGAPEVCDGFDTNCDGATLEGEIDQDQDLYLVCAGDCNDSNSAIHPGAVEIDDNTLDEDCDGWDGGVVGISRDDGGAGLVVSCATTPGGASAGWLAAVALALGLRRRGGQRPGSPTVG